MSAAESPPAFDVVIARDVMVAMRDGVRLATDLCRPARHGEPLPGPFPTILVRTPYDKGLALAGGGPEFWARRGYVHATQDVRGRFASEGAFYLLRDEGADGYDTIEWLAAQPWSDRQVGTRGTSYLAWVQSAAAAHNPPHLKAMWIHQGGFNALTSSLRQGGALELRWLSWAFWNGAVSREALADPALAAALDEATVQFGDWLRRLPLRPGRSPLSLIPNYERWALDLYTSGLAGEPLWQSTGLNFEAHAEASADVATVYSGGWYDSYTRATSEAYQRFSRIKTAPQRLLMGPWTHGELPLGVSHAGDVDLGPAAPVDGNLGPDFQHLQLRFFDQHLKGLDNGLDEEAPVRIFVMGGGSGRRLASGRLDHGGRWRDEHEWPLRRARTTAFYLRAEGGLAPEPPPAEGAPSRYDFDPERPVPTISANISSLCDFAPADPALAQPLSPVARRRNLVLAGGADQRERPGVFGAAPPYLPLAARPDVLVFQTDPLASELELTGAPLVSLWVSTSAADTDFTAKLIDVYPPSDDYPQGYALNLSDSIKRLRFRDGYEAERFVTPGAVVAVTIELYPTSNLFAAGHRIRLDISSSNFPRFDVNPNTGEPLGRHTHTVVAHNAVHHDAAHASRIDLPIVPA